MISRTDRDHLALLLRRLASGRIYNDDYDGDQPCASTDLAVTEIGWEGWGLYSDDRRYRLRGPDSLPRESREHVARAVLFLQSDLEYEWPPFPRPGGVVLHVRLLREVLTLGLVGWAAPRTEREWRAAVDLSVWPFRRRADLDACNASPRLFKGVAP